MGGPIECRFRVSGDVSEIVWPDLAAPRHQDGLWRSTCFEAFVAPVDQPSYQEFNWSPSGAFAHYAFADYRRPGPAPVAQMQTIEADRGVSEAMLVARLPGDAWPRGPLSLGLSAVVELKTGAHQYFAIRHFAERPDFHDRRGFTITVPAE
jgi:hypothetical protein